MDVGIVGGSGYGGGELVRLLDAHPTLKLRTVAAHTHAGRRLGEVFPNLAGSVSAGLTLVPSEPEEFDGCDLVLLATPSDASRVLAPALLDRVALVVDLSDAFRLVAEPLRAPAVEAAPERAGETAPAPTAYGLPELYGEHLAGARLVATPGCFPTAALLAIAPLAGLVDPATVVVVGMSGTSGAGRGLREDLHASHAFGNVVAYGAPTHRHTPEVAAGWATLSGEVAPVTFVPHLVPTVRGLVCTVTASLRRDPAAVRPAYEEAYATARFVHLVPVGTWPAATNVVGGNGVHVGVAVDAAAGRVVASCAEDNLVKGAAGQALQNANLLLGLDEGAGLSSAGVYP